MSVDRRFSNSTVGGVNLWISKSLSRNRVAISVLAIRFRMSLLATSSSVTFSSNSRVHRTEFFIERLQFLFGCFQFFVCRLKFLIHRHDFFIGGFEILVGIPPVPQSRLPVLRCLI